MRFTNTLLLFLTSLMGLSGLVMLYGDWQPWIFDLHRILGFTLLVALPWKGVIVYHSLRRGFDKSFDRSGAIVLSMVLALLLVTVITAGLAWMWRQGPFSVLYQTLLAWHWILGLLLVPFFLFHLWRRWPNPQVTDVVSRRSFLSLASVFAGGLAASFYAGCLAERLAAAERPRRFTGSQGFLGRDFPLTGEAPPRIDLSAWRLAVGTVSIVRMRLSYEDLLNRPAHTIPVTLDCTSGWFTTQNWGGIRLVDLLEEASLLDGAAGVRLVSTTGYGHTFPILEARRILLATHVGGQLLNATHGSPLRAVVPGRRGWFWVKWLAAVVLLASPAQVAAGILTSPAEVLSQWE